MEQIPPHSPPPESPKEKQEWGELLKNYLGKLQNIPANTLELSPEEQQALPPKRRTKYNKRTDYFRELYSQDDAKTPEGEHPGYLFSHVIEELLARHDALSQNWNNVRGNPKIVRTSPPDDLQGTDLVFSFSENIACAVDVTLASEESASGEKKLKRRQWHEKNLKQATLSFWRFPDGTIGKKEFPFLPLHIFGSKAAAFIKTSAADLAESQGNAYQDQYKNFFTEIMGVIAEEAKKMAQNMLKIIQADELLSPDLVTHIMEIIRKPTKTQEKMRALIALREFIENDTQRTYFDLLLRYQIIHTSAKVVAKQLLSRSIR